MLFQALSIDTCSVVVIDFGCIKKHYGNPVLGCRCVNIHCGAAAQLQDGSAEHQGRAPTLLAAASNLSQLRGPVTYYYSYLPVSKCIANSNFITTAPTPHLTTHKYRRGHTALLPTRTPQPIFSSSTISSVSASRLTTHTFESTPTVTLRLAR